MNDKDLVVLYRQQRRYVLFIISAVSACVFFILGLLTWRAHQDLAHAESLAHDLQQKIAVLQQISAKKTEAETVNKEISQGIEKIHSRLERHDDQLQRLLLAIAQAIPQDTVLQELSSTKTGYLLQGTTTALPSLHNFLAALRQAGICIAVEVRSLERSTSDQTVFNFTSELICTEKKHD